MAAALAEAKTALQGANAARVVEVAAAKTGPGHVAAASRAKRAEAQTKDPAMLYLCSSLACLVFGIFGFTAILRTGKSSASDLKKADLVTALTWGGCFAATIMNRDLFKFDKLCLNLGLQAFFTAAYLYQCWGRQKAKMF